MNRWTHGIVVILCVGAALVLTASSTAASAVAASGRAWSWQRARSGSRGLIAVSCPSTRFCAAVGSSGDVLTATNPAGGARAWKRVHIDRGSLTAISCPTSKLCVAVDRTGHVVTSTHPSGGSSAWHATAVGPASLSGVTCVSIHQCLAIDLAGNVAVSAAPTRGRSAWRLLHVDYETSAGCVEDPYSEPNCQPGLTGVACPSASECILVDNEGFPFTIFDKPGSVAPIVAANQYAGPFTGEYDALACASGSLCIGSCPALTGTGGCLGANYGDGSVIAWNPRTWQPSTPTPRFTTVARTQIPSLWCRQSACFAADTQGNIYTSSNVTTRGSRWIKTYEGHNPVTGGTCPIANECVAVDRIGHIIVGRRRLR